MHPAPLEVEAKLEVRRENDLRANRPPRPARAYRLRLRDAVRLHSAYVDTANLTLARHGVALRLRRQGDKWEATAKWSGRVAGSVHERPELTVPLAHEPRLPFALPPGPLHVYLSALVAGRPLQPSWSQRFTGAASTSSHRPDGGGSTDRRTRARSGAAARAERQGRARELPRG